MAPRIFYNFRMFDRVKVNFMLALFNQAYNSAFHVYYRCFMMLKQTE